MGSIPCSSLITSQNWNAQNVLQIAYIMSIHIRYSMMQQFSHLSPAQSHCRPSPHPFRSDAIKHKHFKDCLAIYSKATIKMEDTASTSTKPYVMYIILPWHRSGCRTVRPEDARFPSLCCCMCGCGCGVCLQLMRLWSPQSPLFSLAGSQSRAAGLTQWTTCCSIACSSVTKLTLRLREHVRKHTHLPQNVD